MGDKIRMNEMSWACSRYGGEEMCIEDYSGKT